MLLLALALALPPVIIEMEVVLVVQEVSKSTCRMKTSGVTGGGRMFYVIEPPI